MSRPASDFSQAALAARTSDLGQAPVLVGQALAGAEGAKLAEALKHSRALETALAMRRELTAIWERSTASKEQLLRQLQDWCHRAEASGIAPLVDFSHRLRSYAAA